MTTNKDRETAAQQGTVQSAELCSDAEPNGSESLLNSEALARGHKLAVVPVQRVDDFPWYEIPDEFLGRAFRDEHAILEFSGFWKGSGPQWTLYMDDVYADDIYELGGEPENPPVREAIAHLDTVRKPIPMRHGAAAPPERLAIGRKAREHPGEGLIVRRAMAKYVSLKNASGSLPSYVPRPSSASYVAEHEGRRYVVLHNLNAILAVFRIDDGNMLELQDTWPKEIEEG
jgi:hypothetical protein